MKKSIKLVTAAATAMMLGGTILPATGALADTVSYSNTVANYEDMTSDQLGDIIQNYNMDSLTATQEKVLNVYLVKVQAEIVAEMQNAPSENQGIQTRGAAGLMARLIAKYGRTYVAKTLPKLLYKKVAKLIGKKVGEATFVRIWNNVMNVATGAALQSAIAKALKACGVPAGVANTAAGVIVTAIEIFV